MLSAFANAFRTPDLRRKILFTLFILAIFRLGSTIPVPGVNLEQVNACRAVLAQGDTAGLFSTLELFSGGALLRLAIFALGIMPYITASIILQLMASVIPRLEQLKKEGAAGTAKITQYTRYLTIALALLQATAFVTMARNDVLFTNCPGVLYDKGLFAVLTMILVMTAGTGIIMWLGELITDRGIGNGMSILIFTQIAAQFPAALWQVKVSNSQGADQGWVVFFLVVGIGLLVMLGILFMEMGQRRIPVHYAKRMVGRRLFGGSTTYIPLKVNQSGVIPVIFASSMLYLPMLLAQFFPQSAVGIFLGRYFTPGQAGITTGTIIYNVVFFLLIIAFCYFYVSITFNPQEIADNMKKYGGFIPGVRAGKQTENYLAYVLSRLTAPGSLYLALISLIPTLAFILLGANQNFPFGGTSILILVGVALNTVQQIESQLQQRHYEGFLR